MEDIRDLSIEINLKSVDYLVNVEIVEQGKFVLEIQSIQTAEVWQGCYEANCKQFNSIYKPETNLPIFEFPLSNIYQPIS